MKKILKRILQIIGMLCCFPILLILVIFEGLKGSEDDLKPPKTPKLFD